MSSTGRKEGISAGDEEPYVTVWLWYVCEDEDDEASDAV